MSDFAEYNRLLAEAKIKALQALRRLLETCDDPIESRRIADAILKATNGKQRPVPVTLPKAALPAPPSSRSFRVSDRAIDALYLDTRSLTIDPAAPQQFDAHAPSPIALAPRDETPSGGGPAPCRPFPLPLGPPRA